MILETPAELYAIEIKATKSPSRKHFRGVTSFSEQVGSKPLRGRWVVCQAPHRQSFGELGDALPYFDALDALKET